MSDKRNYAIKVADHVSAMLAYWDKDLICRFANAAYIDWFGKSREEMVDKMTIMELLGPQLYEKNKIYIEAALRGEAQTFEREIPLPGGGTRQSLANYYPDIVDGEVLGFYVHVADVSILKKLEKELIDSNQITIDQNNRLLNLSNIISHNLRTYAANLSLILNLHEPNDPAEEQMKTFDLLKKVSDQFNTTLEQLTEITKSQNELFFPSNSINIHQFIEKIKGILFTQINNSNALIQNNVSPDLYLVANPAYMESIIMNLLSNAIKYHKEDETPIIICGSSQTNNELILTFEDNGKGIDLKKYGTKLFGLYETFHGNPDAHGIGLYITKFQVESMKGKILVSSEVGKGTKFSLVFTLNTEN